MEAKQTALFEKTGAFFAFSKRQFEEKYVKGQAYVSFDGGMFCRAECETKLADGLEAIYKESIQKDIKLHGADQVIERELYNHEAFYTGCIQSTVEALEDYPFDLKQIKAVFNRLVIIESQKD